MTEAEKQRDLEALQDAIYRDKVLRARAMTPEQRLDEVFELTNSVLGRMLDGAMWQLDTEDVREAGNEVALRIDRLRLGRDLERTRTEAAVS
jgi:hypothetical protein